MRVGLPPREGLVFHQVDGQRPPGDLPASMPRWWCRTATRARSAGSRTLRRGEYLLGGYANSLELGCDCVGEITYIDAAVADNTVRPT